MRTVVAKFGGTSLADAKQFRKIKEIVKADPDRRIIVASAPGKRFPEDIKITDLLQKCYDLAFRGQNFEPVLDLVEQRFADIISGLNEADCADRNADADRCSDAAPQLDTDRLLDINLKAEIDTVRAHLKGIPHRDYVVSRGEYINSRILAAYLGYTFVDPAWCVCFDDAGKLDLPMTIRAMGASLKPLPNAVVAGFYGADMNGIVHTLSRGGSDVTGSLAAAAIHADLYENWTDVSGLLAADPRIVDQPKPVKYVSYRELRTLSYMGASVLHTDAVLPVSDTGIPINIRNTNKPEDGGTVIVRQLPEGEEKYPIIAVAGRKGMSVIQVEKVMVSDESGFTAIMLDILKNRRLPFEQCLTGIDTVTLVIRSDLLSSCKESLFDEITQKLHPDFLGLVEDLSMIAVIGEKGTLSCDANIRVLQCLTQADIPVCTINQGAGKLNLLIGVPDDRYEDAIKTVYGAIESEK